MQHAGAPGCPALLMLLSQLQWSSSLVGLWCIPLQAEAAAASDLLSLWRQRLVLGKPLEARNYNLGLARYRWALLSSAQAACA